MSSLINFAFECLDLFAHARASGWHALVTRLAANRNGTRTGFSLQSFHYGIMVVGDRFLDACEFGLLGFSLVN